MSRHVTEYICMYGTYPAPLDRSIGCSIFDYVLAEMSVRDMNGMVVTTVFQII